MSPVGKSQGCREEKSWKLSAGCGTSDISPPSYTWLSVEEITSLGKGYREWQRCGWMSRPLFGNKTRSPTSHGFLKLQDTGYGSHQTTSE